MRAEAFLFRSVRGGGGVRTRKIALNRRMGSLWAYVFPLAIGNLVPPPRGFPISTRVRAQVGSRWAGEVKL